MRKDIDMINGKLSSNIIRFTIPIILTSLLQLLFNAADLVIVGRFSGSIYVGAVSATGAITNLITNLFIGLSVGAGVTVAHGLGSKNDEEVFRTVHTALPMSFLGSLVLTLIGVMFSENFLSMMRTPENVLPHSATYMRILFIGMPFSMVYNFSASILRAAGDTRSPLIFLSLAGVINVLLNVFFVTAFGMNVDGVALATIISQAISCILVVIALMRRTDSCKLYLNKMRFYKKQLVKILKIGLPAGIQSSLFSISNVIIQSSINSFNSDAVMAGNGAAANIEGFVFVIMNSFHQAAVNFTGQNVGARRYDRVKKVYSTTLLYVAIAGLTTGSLMWIFAKPLLSLYITDSPEAIVYGATRLAYLALPYFLCGIMDVSTGSLRGLGSSFIPMVISVLGVCGIRITWIYTVFQIPQYHTLPCLYLSYTVSWTFTFLVQTLAFIILYKKKSQQDHSLRQA